MYKEGIFEEEMRESKWQRVAKFSLGVQHEGKKILEMEEEKKYRICEREEQTCKYIWDDCVEKMEAYGKKWRKYQEKKKKGKDGLKELEELWGKRRNEYKNEKLSEEKKEGERRSMRRKKQQNFVNGSLGPLGQVKVCVCVCIVMCKIIAPHRNISNIFFNLPLF